MNIKEVEEKKKTKGKTATQSMTPHKRENSVDPVSVGSRVQHRKEQYRRGKKERKKKKHRRKTNHTSMTPHKGAKHRSGERRESSRAPQKSTVKKCKK
jgi:hypothetical protein